MKAQVIKEFGNASVFQTVELPRPEVIPGHVLIRVAATSINPVDYKIRRGSASALAPAFPAVLQGDVAGVIEEVGEGVTSFKSGDEVYACAGGVKGTGGALADYMLADADLVALKPKSLTMLEAAALPLVSLTAWEGLIDKAQIQPGQTVLVHAATGGVGHIGIQIAKAFGAKVFATASSDQKLELARKLGADVAINYRQQTIEEYVAEYTDGKGFDVVFDTVGGENLTKSFAAAKLNGKVVSISTSQTYDLSPLHRKGLSLHVVFMLIPMLHNLGRAHHGKILTELAKLVDEGKIFPLIDPKEFSFDQAELAHRHLESGQTIGKVVLQA
ncbi:zinc-dependent alcohol dehydrogenase family protein [Calothrix rhizosoleniae]|uniref:zinc-dependent alcohol dehydrogenase family protein n=1 Tax=Calothrix rhizosoleniae TaxID=888997 RepID=UPI000B49D988|nr:zinc-dependent alcohol dehydrogenase family protein [Calothrix rhizosoleniae]